ncbi:MAG: hypothetical protein OIF50_11645 [Flavobacteriaceae bacterium]|nr:hypothetical protein [Flavobacteriaceae bacterium]
MLRFFKKKNILLEDYLIKVVKDPKLNFQIDIFRKKIVEIQIMRQRMLSTLGISFNEPEGLAISICFEDSQSLERFKKSDLIDICVQQKKFNEVYFFLCENNTEKIGYLLNRIQKEVYSYNSDTKYGYRFIKHP